MSEAGKQFGIVHAQRLRIDYLSQQLAEWHTAFGHLSLNADEAACIVNAARDELEQQVCYEQDRNIRNTLQYCELIGGLEQQKQCVEELNAAYAETCARLTEQNAKLVEALERISKLDFMNAEHNRCAYDAVCIAKAVLKKVQDGQI